MDAPDPKDEALRLTLEPGVPLREQIHEWGVNNEVPLVFLEPADAFDQAIVGLVRGWRKDEKGHMHADAVAVLYDEAKVIAQLMTDSDMDEDDAREFFERNIVGAFVGEGTPQFLFRPWE